MVHPRAVYEALIRLWPLGKFVYQLGSRPIVGPLMRPFIDAGIGIKAPYFHASWVLLEWSAGADEIRHRLEQSYDTIRGGLTKKVRASLPPRGA